MNRTTYKNKWQSENCDRINLTVPKGQKQIIADYAKARGESLNAFINRAIKTQMEIDKKDIT